MGKVIFVFHDARFVVLPNGEYYTRSKADAFFWQRYLSEFDKVVVVSRVAEVSEVSSEYKKADCEGVTFEHLCNYRGIGGFVRNILKMVKKGWSLSRRIKKQNATLVFRLPLSLTAVIPMIFNKYSVEVVGDPYDAVAGRTVSSKMIAWLLKVKMKWEVKGAYASSFVTEHSLQKTYPPKRGTFSTNYSSLALLDTDYFLREPESANKNSYQILSVGSLEHYYKGPDVLLHALKKVREKGLDVNLVWVGAGIKLEEVKGLANELGLSNAVNFVGFCDFNEIKTWHKTSDVFVLASRQEGLPRAMIEAMASSMCCVGTDVGGVAELITNKLIAPPDNVDDLASRLLTVLEQYPLRNEQSQLNFEHAQKYKNSLLQKRRNEFYRTIEGQ
ncbi:glycosyltransferase [Psychrosphaera aestuarii]|uniref:glycosyltransferase n=1 Tax=Psychrosphaera aestuarii TaxID=1266052 RepID=UPI001B335DAF|nr:glycosyltransferase family 4 protein [Psychrosphaera aestuarii]